MNIWRWWCLSLMLPSGCTCGALDPNVTRFACSTNDDCATGYSCAPARGALECVRSADSGAGGAGGGGGGGGGGNAQAPHQAAATVVGGVTATSQSYKVIMTTAAPPTGGVETSPQFKKRGGIVGATQGN